MHTYTQRDADSYMHTREHAHTHTSTTTNEDKIYRLLIYEFIFNT